MTCPARLTRLPGRPLPGGVVLHEARTLRARLLGLAGLRAVPGDRALLLRRCRSVHTFGMRVALDLVWLGPAGEVVRVDRCVGPGRVVGCRGAQAVVEAAAGRGTAVAQALSAA
jgi:uncharacterized membrane protein (UPF0127 family)